MALSKRVSLLWVSWCIVANPTAVRLRRYLQGQGTMKKSRMGGFWARFGLVGAGRWIVCLLDTVVLCKVVESVVRTAAKRYGSDFRVC